MYWPTHQPSCLAERIQMPRRISWTSEQARNFRLLAVHVVMKTIGLSRNELACARCLLHFTRVIEPARVWTGQAKSLNMLSTFLVCSARARRLHLLALRVASALISKNGNPPPRS